MKKTSDKQSADAARADLSSGRSESQLSRRRFTGAGLAAPVILSLASRPAFGVGAICTPSGYVSYSPNNPSGVRHVVDGCGGLSPGAWMNPDAGNGDGSRAQWLPYFPNPRQDGNAGPGNSGGNSSNPGSSPFADPPGTLFFGVFGVKDDFGTLHDVLLQRQGSLEFHVVAALLNANTIAGYMKEADVIGLYLATINGLPTYTTIGGSVIPMDQFDLKAFIEQTYH